MGVWRSEERLVAFSKTPLEHQGILRSIRDFNFSGVHALLHAFITGHQM